YGICSYMVLVSDLFKQRESEALPLFLSIAGPLRPPLPTAAAPVADLDGRDRNVSFGGGATPTYPHFSQGNPIRKFHRRGGRRSLSAFGRPLQPLHRLGGDAAPGPRRPARRIQAAPGPAR